MKINKRTVIQISSVVVICLAILILFIIKNTSKIESENVIKERSEVTSNISITENSDLEITTEIDFEELKKHKLPIIIDFGADSCIPCKEMAPVLKELNESLQDRAIIKFVDVWKNQNLAKGIPLQVIPTQIFIDSKGSPYAPSSDNNLQFEMYEDPNTGEHIFTVHKGGLTKDNILDILSDMGME